MELYAPPVPADVFGASLTPGLCGAATGTLICNGSTTQQVNTRPLFHVRCGNISYVGTDLYALAPVNTSRLKPYECAGMVAPAVRPTWHLLGYFAAGVCGALVNATYNVTYCAETATSSGVAEATTTIIVVALGGFLLLVLTPSPWIVQG